MDPELAEIGRQQFHFPWCTGYSQKRYLQVLHIIINKYPNDYFPQRLLLILLFEIESKIYNTHLERLDMHEVKDLEGLHPE